MTDRLGSSRVERRFLTACGQVVVRLVLVRVCGQVVVSKWSYLYQLGDCSVRWRWSEWRVNTHSTSTMREGMEGWSKPGRDDGMEGRMEGGNRKRERESERTREMSCKKVIFPADLSGSNSINSPNSRICSRN